MTILETCMLILAATSVLQTVVVTVPFAIKVNAWRKASRETAAYKAQIASEQVMAAMRSKVAVRETSRGSAEPYKMEKPS